LIPNIEELRHYINCKQITRDTGLINEDKSRKNKKEKRQKWIKDKGQENMTNEERQKDIRQSTKSK